MTILATGRPWSTPQKREFALFCVLFFLVNNIVFHPTCDSFIFYSSCSGWSRVLYSTEVKLFPWIPEFVITFLTKTALIEVRHSTVACNASERRVLYDLDDVQLCTAFS